MTIIRFSEKIASDKVFAILKESYLSEIVAYFLSSGYRESTRLSVWMKGQVDAPSKLLKEFADAIPFKKSVDAQVIECLRAVEANIIYSSDMDVWKLTEKWQTAEETIKMKTGDCEDGAILLYVLCRLKGVPANQLLLMAGDVVGGGHCWLAYRPERYPLNFAFLDWCYWYSPNGIEGRNLYQVLPNNHVIGHDLNKQQSVSKYKKLWFSFNEEKSYKLFALK